MAVAFLDVDHFKSINDDFGHEYGDAVLSDLAVVLKQTCRATDLVGRYGGEEFCIILPGMKYDEVRYFGDRLLQAVKVYPFRHRKEVTISIGFAMYAGAGSGQTWTQLIRQADRALYGAKEGGSNQYRIAPLADDSGVPSGQLGHLQ